MEAQTDPTQIQGLPPGAILKPINAAPPATPTVKGLPPGAIVKPLAQKQQQSQESEPGDETAGPSLHELSAQNPDKEGTYKMKDAHGGVFQVPYSNVELVDDFRNNFVDENEAKRYEKDAKATPSWKEQLLKHTAPLSEDERAEIQKKYPTKAEATGWGVSDADFVIANKDFARGFANGSGTLLLHPWDTLKGLVNQGTGLISEIVSDMPGGHGMHGSAIDQQAADFRQMLSDLKKQYHTNSPYLLGQLAGQALVAKGAAKAIGAAPKVIESAKTMPNTFAKEMAVIRPPTAAKAVQETIETNKAAAEKAADANAKATAEHLEKTQGALHETEGKELTHQQKTQQVEEENQAKREEHAKAVKETNDHNTEVAATTREANKLKQRIVPKSGPSRFKVIQDAAKQYFEKKYNRLSKLIGARAAPLDELVEGVEAAKAKLEGSASTVAVFKDIETRAKGEASASENLPPEWHEMSPDEQKEWLQERSKRGNQITFDDLRGYYRELGKVIGSESTAPDIKQAAVAVREVLDKMQKDLADSSGPRAKQIYNEVSREYRDYAQTMLDRTGPKASATAKALAEPDADNALKKFEDLPDSERSRELGLLAGRDSPNADWLRGVEGETPGKLEQLTTPVEERAAAGGTSVRVGESERLRNMRNYRLDTEKLVRQYLAAKTKLAQLDGYRDLPPHPKIEDLPEPPVRTAPPDRPEEIQAEIKQLGEEEITEANRKQYLDRLDAFTKRGVYYLGLLPWLRVIGALLRGDFGTAGIEAIHASMLTTATIAGLSRLAEVLERPAVREWVVKPSAAELRELDKLPPEMRKQVAKGIQNIRMVAAKEDISVSPKLVEFMRENKPSKDDEPPPAAPAPTTPPQSPPAAPAVTPATPETAPKVEEKVVEPAEPARGAEEVKLPVETTKYEFGSTQHDIPADSEAAKALTAVREKIAPEDLVETGQGNDAGEEPHVTVRYGLTSDNHDGVVAYLERQKPFEAKLGKVTSFPPSPSSNGRAPLISEVISPELHRINAEIGQHGDFKKSDFPDYKPHATVGYVKPEAAEKYVGDTTTEGKTFKVDSISISDRNGNRQVVRLKGDQNAPAPEPTRQRAPLRRLEDLHLDPKRFQYKLGGNKAGVTDTFSDVEWDQSLADPIHTWVDPEDGKEYVVNGHHRYDLAKKAGAEHIEVNQIDNTVVKTAAEARKFGALKNIADGNGTSVDAAKFFRESGLGPDDLKKYNISLKKVTASDGLAMARLTDDIFNRVVDDRLDPKLGAAIGEATGVPAEQEAILKDITRKERAGETVTSDQIRESARLIKSAPSFDRTTMDLFGEHNETANLFIEMGDVSDYIQKHLASEKRAFGSVAKEGTGELLKRTGNITNAAKNAEEATRLAQQRELYSKRSTRAGPIHNALREAAERLAEGDNPNEVKQQAYDEIRELLGEELGGK